MAILAFFIKGFLSLSQMLFLIGGDKSGRWRLSPAYDVMFSANTWEDPSAHIHCMGLMGKKSSITKSDLIEFAEDFVDDAESKIQKVQDAISLFPSLCRKYNIDDGVIKLINDVLLKVQV